MKAHTALNPDDKGTEIATIKQEIKHIKAHFAVKADVIRWTVGVGVASVLAITGMVVNLDTRMTHIDMRLTQEIREVRKEMRENQQETRQAITEISKEVREMRENQQKTWQAIAEILKKLEKPR